MCWTISDDTLAKAEEDAQAAIKEKDETIAKLREELTNKNEELADLQSQMDSMSREIALLTMERDAAKGALQNQDYNQKVSVMLAQLIDRLSSPKSDDSSQSAILEDVNQIPSGSRCHESHENQE